ncbi:hypothetical protein C5B42_02445 [Candidatus Cerribacteria bacterium 'Amazon FNV 2010 28 9']|uniref:DUF2090 domain-containing protein n=1 Tax=Candidatus Cerribacteria bacterium 'Amazon FNV 2010 28 9' TaxID=2081795 RepID=A0A317JT48_9BACT|nr:MAG: hypothetical protein C5B42_02445 [Candidatus Cerribacteria bacterium 'Amazon FNV 2010 28 9']
MTLQAFQTPDGFLTIAPFDHRNSLAEKFHFNIQNPDDFALFLELKKLFMSQLSPYVSSVLTDPDIGIETIALKASKTGLFLSLEESSYDSDHDAMTILKENWGIDEIKKRGAGAKLLVYFNPLKPTATKKLELIRVLFEEAKKKGIIFLLEPVLYGVADKNWEIVHLQMCELVAPYCDILKIQYPGSAISCEKVNELHDHWILLSRGVLYEEFARDLRIAAAAGCTGFAAGRAVWQEVEATKDPVHWKQFLDDVAVPRLIELTQILRSSYKAS